MIEISRGGEELQADNGRSIVEVLGVMAIMGIITVLGIAGYQRAVEKERRERFETQLHNLSSTIAEVYAGRRFPQRNAYVYFTDEVEKLGLNMTDPWGNAIRVRYPVEGVDSSDQFVFAFKMGKQRCEWILSKFENMHKKGELCATLWPTLTSIDICDNRGCIEDDNFVTFKYRVM
jgi:type II secretory pathway pseudopilin PulG